MTNVDDLFKASGSISKRKLDQPIRDPNEIYKASKLSDSSHPHAQVEDDVDDNDTNNNPVDDDDFGPELPPDDEEGRFFGGGISKQESEILDFVDKADAGGDVDKLDSAWLKKTVLNLEKLITKNSELRARFEDQPHKFIDSEAELDAEIKNLSLLAEASHLYGEFVKLGSAASLVGLLTHDNTDIAIDAIEIIGELTDDDVVTESEQWDTLVGALIDSDLLSLLVSNLSRFNEDDESDRNGVYHSLSVLENLSSQKAVATRMCEEDDLLKWLLQRIQRTESPVTQNKQYAAEILAILVQAAPENREKLVSLDIIDTMLQLVAPYRRRDPEKGGPEEEFVENLFECLTCLVDTPAGRAKFLEAEGTELCLILIKESKMAKHPSLRLLDHATAGTASAEICQRIVESGGLKTTFTLFNKTQDQRLVGPLLSIFSSMLRFLPADAAERIRLLAKFVEKEYEKTARLVKLHRDYTTRIKAAEEAHRQEAAAARSGDAEEDLQIQLLSRKMDAGLFNLQLVDVILAWLVAEDGGAKQKIEKLLAETDDDLKAIQRTLKEQLDELDTSEEDSKDLGEMLGTLIDFLD
ncbi:Catenin-beta-like protein [Trichoderma novae-zelandiae]